MTALGSPLVCSGGWLPRSVSKVLVTLIIVTQGSARKLPSGHKASLEVLLGYTGSGPCERRSSSEMGEFQPLLNALCIVYQAEVKNPAGRVLHYCAATSLTQRITPQANSHSSATKAMQISGAFKAAGLEVETQRAGTRRTPAIYFPTSTADLVPTRCHERRDRSWSCSRLPVPLTDLSLALLMRTLLGIMAMLAWGDSA